MAAVYISISKCRRYHQNRAYKTYYRYNRIDFVRLERRSRTARVPQESSEPGG